MSAMASQITSLTVVYSIVYSGAHQRKHQTSASLAIVRGIHRWLVNFLHIGPVTRKVFPFDDVIISSCELYFYLVIAQLLLDPNELLTHSLRPWGSKLGQLDCGANKARNRVHIHWSVTLLYVHTLYRLFNNRSARRPHAISSTILNEVAWTTLVIWNHRREKELPRKQGKVGGQHCACWWPNAVRC